jgi:disulfide bond formation protein DsbB
MNRCMVPFNLVILLWLVALLATAGSLFFSEVMEFIPCSLCWYQRVFMYPLVILLFVGSRRSFTEVIIFCLPLVGLGWLIALYHNLLQWGLIPETASPCIEGISCSARYIEWYGFVTIPLLSLLAFSILGLGLIYGKRKFI